MGHIDCHHLSRDLFPGTTPPLSGVLAGRAHALGLDSGDVGHQKPDGDVHHPGDDQSAQQPLSGSV